MRFCASKTVLCLLVLFTIILPAKGQTTLKMLPVQSYKLSIEDIWNATVVNSGAQTLKVYLVGQFFDKNNQPILEVYSKYFDLSSGVTNVSPYNTETSKLAFQNEMYRDIINKTGNFPNDKYTLCLKLIEFESINPIAEDCRDYFSLSVAPPDLLSPGNGAEINIDHPVFTWTPPKPYVPGMHVSYNIKYVEVLPGQTPEEAILNNPAWYSATDIAQNMLQYPIDAQQLLMDRKYAWQVHAIDDDSKADLGATEIWSFHFPLQKPVKLNDSICFVLLKEGNDAEYYTASKLLPFSFDNDHHDESFEVKLFNNADVDITPRNLKITRASKDGNGYFIDLQSYDVFKPNSYYLMKVHTQDNRSYYIKFKVQE